MWWQSVRSIIAFLVVVTYCFGFAFGMVEGGRFTEVVIVIIAFYFYKNRPEVKP